MKSSNPKDIVIVRRGWVSSIPFPSFISLAFRHLQKEAPTGVPRYGCMAYNVPVDLLEKQVPTSKDQIEEVTLVFRGSK